MFWASAAAAFMGDLERGNVLAARAAALARLRGEVALLANALASSAAYLLVENRFAEAAANAEESARLGREIGAENLTGLPLGVLAMVAAVRGRDDEVRQLADQVAGFANERGLALPSASPSGRSRTWISRMASTRRRSSATTPWPRCDPASGIPSPRS